MTELLSTVALCHLILGVLHIIDGRKVNVGIAFLIIAVLMMLGSLLHVQLEILEMIK